MDLGIGVVSNLTKQGETGAVAIFPKDGKDVSSLRMPLRLFVWVVLAFLATLALGAFLILQHERNQVLEKQRAAMDVASMHAHLLQQQINRSLSATYALAAVLRQGKGQIDNFEALAQEMLRMHGSTSVLQLAPGGIISRIVPLAGNQAALGHDLLQDPGRNKEAFVAVETKRLTLAGPFKLRQGGTAVVGRLPVFLPTVDGGEHFWGFTTALVTIPDLLAASKLDNRVSSDYGFELSRIHPDTGRPDTFAKSSAVPLQEPLSYPFEVPNGIWTLRLAPTGGWHSHGIVLAVEAGMVLLLGALVALLTFHVLKQPYVLRREVDRRTQDLVAAYQDLAAQMHKRSLAEAERRERISEMEAILGALSDGVIALDGDARVRYANGAAKAILSLAGEALEGRPLEHLFNLAGAGPGGDIRGICHSVIREREAVHLRGDARIRTMAGLEFDARVSAVPAPGSGEVAMIFVFTDISVEIGKQRQIEFQAFHDPLTELGNRTLLTRDLALEMARSGSAGERLALLCLDLDNFRNINDALGHAIGDILLKQLAQRLRSAVCAPGWVTRHGGDEFIIVVPRLMNSDQARKVAETLMEAIARPFHIDEKDLRVTSSIGISIYPDHGASIGELVSNADMAMFEAKRSGRNTFCFYETAQLQRSAARLSMENGLRVALAEKEFSLVFQPKVRIDSGRVDSVEALLRWNSKRVGPVSPVSFIPVAEDMGLIIDIGEWVLRESLAASRRLRSRLGHEIAVAVNVSPVQFRSRRFIEVLRELAGEEPNLPGLLEIELTEQALAGDMEVVSASLRDIKDLGLKIAIDDFGTGYSSLAYLKNFPIDILKIDRAFIRDLHVAHQDRAIVGSVVNMGKSLGFDIVAEGVEEGDHVSVLAQLGCDYAQGYWFSRPVSEQDLEICLQAGFRTLLAN